MRNRGGGEKKRDPKTHFDGYAPARLIWFLLLLPRYL